MAMLARISCISHHRVTNKGGKIKCMGTFITHSKKGVTLMEKAIVHGTKSTRKFYRTNFLANKSVLKKKKVITYTVLDLVLD